MNTLRTIFIHITYHIMIGSTIYLTILATGLNTISPTPKHITELFGMIILISLLIPLLESQYLEELPFAWKIALHCLGTFLIVSGSVYVFNWHFLDENIILSFVLSFILIYPIVWLVLYLYWWITASKINSSLRLRHEKHGKNVN